MDKDRIDIDIVSGKRDNEDIYKLLLEHGDVV